MARMRGWVTTVLDLVGAGVIVTGLALVSAPAALIVGGALILVASWRCSR